MPYTEYSYSLWVFQVGTNLKGIIAGSSGNTYMIVNHTADHASCIDHELVGGSLASQGHKFGRMANIQVLRKLQHFVNEFIV